MQVAHRVAADYPDGQLYAELHGFSDPVPPVEVLARLLRALGTEPPEDPAERCDLFRGLLARRRVLLVLDDAGCEAQVRPLLPGSALRRADHLPGPAGGPRRRGPHRARRVGLRPAARGVVWRLARAARLLPEGLCLLVTEGYRPFVPHQPSPPEPGPHVAGAAVDLTHRRSPPQPPYPVRRAHHGRSHQLPAGVVALVLR